MGRFPSLPLFTDAFIADTGHLSGQETGAYLLLMMMAWRSPGCCLPDDDDKLARWARVERRTWARIKPAVMDFWTLADGHWRQARLSREHEFVSKRAEVNRLNGAQGGRPKSLKNRDTVNPAGSTRVSETKAPNPNPIPSEVSPPQDAPAEADPSSALSLKDQLWIEGKASLVGMGLKEAKAGSMIGRWLRDTEGDAGRILWAIGEARRTATGDPVPYVARLLSNSPVTQRGRTQAPASKDGIATLLRDLEGRRHGEDRHDSGAKGAGAGTGDRSHRIEDQERRGPDGGPIIDLEPIRPERR